MKEQILSLLASYDFFPLRQCSSTESKVTFLLHIYICTYVCRYVKIKLGWGARIPQYYIELHISAAYGLLMALNVFYMHLNEILIGTY